MADEPIVPQINTVNPTSADVTAGGGTPNIDATQVPLSSSPAAAAPNTGAQNTPMPRPANPADVNNNAAGNPNANVPQTPAQKHASIFHSVFSMLGGGGNRPQRDAQGNPVLNPDGTVKMGQASTKQLGMGILAGAISGMVAGMATPSKYNEVAPGRFQPDYSGSVAAGAQAAQPFTQQGAKNQAQQQADDQKTRQFATMDHNMKLHAALLSNLKMQGDLLDAGTDEDEPLIKGLTTAPPIQDPTDPTKTIDPIREQGVPEDKLQGMMKDGSVTRQSVLRDGKIQSTDADGKPIFNPDGTPHMQWTYTVYDRRAMVAMTNEMKGLSHKLDDVAPGTMVPISALAKYQQQNTELRGAQQSIDNKMKALGKDTINLKTAPDANLIRSIAPQIAKYGTDPVDLMFKDLRADKTVSGAAVSALANAMGVNDESLEKMGEDRDARKAADKEKALEAVKPLTKDEAESNLSKPDITPVERTRAEKFLQIYNQQEADKKRTSDAIEQSVKQGDPVTAGKLLYDGTLTLSELKGRSVTPKFIADATNAGLAMARQNGEPDWTPQRAEAQFHAAESNQNVQFFGSANSLLDPTGTLSQLKSQHAQLGNTPFPLLNSVKDYLEYQASDPALAGFMQTAIGVADDYAKVMGGGVGSDVSRLQVLKSFANAHSPQQMDAALSAARNAVKSQVAARIGRNRVMQQMYGQNVPQAGNVASKPPAGATSTLHDANNNVVGWRVNGNLIGIDGKPYGAPQQ